MKKILIIHDRFKFKGGAERLVLIMAHGLKADIATEYWNAQESFAKSEASGKVITLGKQVRYKGLSYFSAQWRFFWQTGFIKDYDVIIFSGNNCLSSAWRCKKHQKKIMYCHTPVRYAYDLKDYYLQQKPWWQKLPFLFFVFLARIIYQWGINKMDLVLGNSKNVQARLKKYCHVESTVVYPPIDVDKFQSHPTGVGGQPSQSRYGEMGGRGEYYLSFGRVDKLKRVDDIVRAFQKMPPPLAKSGASNKLIVASGGPELENIKKMARGHNNIQILGWVSDEQLAELVGNCIATIYIPLQEDFGMTPLEAGAAGKPTIGIDDGGLKESVVHKKTGYLVQKNYTIDNLVEAVRWMDAERAAEMSDDCVQQVQRFRKEIFVEKIKEIVV